MKFALLPSIAALGLIATPVMASATSVAAKAPKTADIRDIFHKKHDRGKDRGVQTADIRDIFHKKHDRGKDRG